MSSDIKAGDWVMVVRPMPCCGQSPALGSVFVVEQVMFCHGDCDICGTSDSGIAAICPQGYAFELNRLKKIDPPATGDSLPTRIDLEVTA
jgi:hypothetical protein